MNRFIASQGKYFFLANPIVARPKFTLSTTILKSSFFKLPISSPFINRVSTRIPIRSKPSFLLLKNANWPKPTIPPVIQKPTTTASTIQLRQFSSSGVLKYIRISNNNYRKNYNVLKQASVFCVIFIGATTFIMPYLFQYTPLSTFARHPSIMVYSLIGMNLLVFGLWRVPSMWKIMNRYALLEKDVMYSKWSIIGSTFSHQELWHLGMNMLALYSLGTSLASMIGSSNFLSLYLNSSVLASVFSIAYPLLFKIPISAPSIGASGALFGVFACFSYLIPNAKIMLFVFPIPGGASVAFLGSLVWNLAGCALKWGSLDYAAHLGGSLFGVLYGVYISEKIKRQRERNRRARSVFGW